ncbi:MAG TPA: ornithine cyclodeaminase family protein [Candidatus Binatia bacterium]|nr:ornithine cyclodeaminase family protein [Candidatus Binatia bacterium]
MALLLTRQEVEPLIDLAKAIELTEAAYRQQSLGQAVAHAPYHLNLGGEKALRVVSGALLGARNKAVLRAGPSYGLGGNRMYALLFDTETGELLSVMGYPFGTLRTSATIALAARHMAREYSKRMGLFGIGRSALHLLKGLLSVRPLGEVTVFSRDDERRKDFCLRAAQALQLQIRPAQKAEEAVRGMDIVLTATNSLSPVLSEEWVEPGLHISSMGKPSELAAGIFERADRIVVGSKLHEENYHDRSAPLPLLQLVEEGKLTWERIGELGDLVSGRFSGRAHPNEITVFRESQGGFGDAAFAAWVYGEAIRKGLGRELVL